MEKLNKLIQNCKCSISLDINSHRDYYETIEQYFNNNPLLQEDLKDIDSEVFEKRFWEFLNAYRATSLSGVPYTFQMLEKVGFLKMDLPFLKILTQAGGRLSDDLNLKFSEWSFKNNKRFFWVPNR